MAHIQTPPLGTTRYRHIGAHVFVQVATAKADEPDGFYWWNIEVLPATTANIATAKASA